MYSNQELGLCYYDIVLTLVFTWKFPVFLKFSIPSHIWADNEGKVNPRLKRYLASCKIIVADQNLFLCRGCTWDYVDTNRFVIIKK